MGGDWDVPEEGLLFLLLLLCVLLRPRPPLFQLLRMPLELEAPLVSPWP